VSNIVGGINADHHVFIFEGIDEAVCREQALNRQTKKKETTVLHPHKLKEECSMDQGLTLGHHFYGLPLVNNQT
jgi:hypothetical protein